jgi:predicted nucleic acid-binding protein
LDGQHSRKSAGRRLSRCDYRSVGNDLDLDWDDYFIVDVSESVVRPAGILAKGRALRGTDAIHLASAVTLSKQIGESVMFLCFDGGLATVAGKEGLRIVK